MSRALMQMALDALLESKPINQNDDASMERSVKAIAALEAELAKPEQEPVAYQVMTQDEPMKEFSTEYMAHDWAVKQKLGGSPYSFWVRPLYISPPRKEWVGLTDEEVEDAWGNTPMMLNARDGGTRKVFARAIAAKLKEKNT